jgi:hypothetical protein
MAKQSSIERRSIIEALSNAMFRVELENGHIRLLIYLKNAYALHQIITW